MNNDVSLDRFKFNVTMALALLWIVLSGACSASIIYAGLVHGLHNQGDDIFYRGAIGLGVFFLLPGFLAWNWGKRRSGYDPARDLKGPIWRVPQVIGIGIAISYWILGARELVFPMRVLTEGDCFGYTVTCNAFMWASVRTALGMWVPGWIFFWASTRP